MLMMKNCMSLVLLIMVLTASANMGFAKQTVLDVASPSFSFTSYLHAGAGAAFIQGESPIQVDLSYGLQLSPGFSLGAFLAVNPLSKFEHADLGVSIADTEAAFALMSGAEFIFTACPDKQIHPFLRLALGGITVGYLRNVDADEGYDEAKTNRSTFTSLSVGLELNITRYTALTLRGGWRFAGHGETMGIEAYGLGGPECSLAFKIVWKSDINRE